MAAQPVPTQLPEDEPVVRMEHIDDEEKSGSDITPDARNTTGGYDAGEKEIRIP